MLRIESFALIRYLNLHAVRDASEGHFNLLGIVLFIPVNDGIRNGFADRHVDTECLVFRDTAIACKVGRRGGCVSNSLNVAGQNESSRLFGHKRRGLPAMGFAVWLLTIQKQNGRRTCNTSAGRMSTGAQAFRESSSFTDGSGQVKIG